MRIFTNKPAITGRDDCFGVRFPVVGQQLEKFMIKMIEISVLFIATSSMIIFTMSIDSLKTSNDCVNYTIRLVDSIEYDMSEYTLAGDKVLFTDYRTNKDIIAYKQNVIEIVDNNCVNRELVE